MSNIKIVIFCSVIGGGFGIGCGGYGSSSGGLSTDPGSCPLASDEQLCGYCDGRCYTCPTTSTCSAQNSCNSSVVVRCLDPGSALGAAPPPE